MFATNDLTRFAHNYIQAVGSVFKVFKKSFALRLLEFLNLTLPTTTRIELNLCSQLKYIPICAYLCVDVFMYVCACGCVESVCITKFR